MIVGCRGTAWSEPRSPVGAGVAGSTEGARQLLPAVVAMAPRRRADRAGPRRPSTRRSPLDRWDRPPGPLPPLAGADVLGDRRPGGGGRDPAQRGRDRQGRARDPVHRAARDGQDVAGPDPRQGAQLHGPPARTRTRATPAPRAWRSAKAAPWTSIEIDAASNRGINDVRELRERLNYAPTDLRRKVYILDEAHQITRDAWNALLKSLEEPPEFVTFMFASTHPQDFPPAILSRLQRFDVRRLTVPEITGKLEKILAADGREADPEAVALVARLAAGGMRDAESILDQLLVVDGRADRGRRRPRPAGARRDRPGRRAS